MRSTANQCRIILQQLGQTVPQNQRVAFMRRQLRIQVGLPANQLNAAWAKQQVDRNDTVITMTQIM